ncbi:MAG: carboxymuconolactone decarboxylase family protein [Proteobacteria bacterium]|nr:carboxymuconolactone decarboxylase family protein [Pseudomonadota bacterium]
MVRPTVSYAGWRRLRRRPYCQTEECIIRIPTKTLSSYPIFLQPFFWNQRRKYGKVLIPGLLWGRVPRLFVAVALLYGVFDRRRSPLDPVLRSLVTVRVSQINWCAFCVDINSATLLDRSGSLAKVDDLDMWEQSDQYTTRERLALEYAEAITYSDRQVSQELMDRLTQHFNEDTIIELTGLIAFQNLSSKFNSALDVAPQGFCHLDPSKTTKTNS